MENYKDIFDHINNAKDSENNLIVTGSGADYLYLQEEINNAVVFTGEGSDLIVSHIKGRAIINAENGDDSIYIMNGGISIITGGEGNDKFHFRMDVDGYAQINDFEHGKDLLFLVDSHGRSLNFLDKNEINYYVYQGDSYIESKYSDFTIKIIGNSNITNDDIFYYDFWTCGVT